MTAIFSLLFFYTYCVWNFSWCYYLVNLQDNLLFSLLCLKILFRSSAYVLIGATRGRRKNIINYYNVVLVERKLLSRIFSLFRYTFFNCFAMDWNGFNMTENSLYLCFFFYSFHEKNLYIKTNYIRRLGQIN